MDISIQPSKRYPDLSVASTIDFFFPLVEDPYMQGRIACANVLSDMYALGVVDVDNMLMVLGVARAIKDKRVRDIVTRQMIAGFSDLAREAGSEVTGGQTVINPWAIIGGVAKSIVKRGDYILPRSAVVGDVLVLTKALGTQVAVNVQQWRGSEADWERVKDLLTQEEAEAAYLQAQASMARLNKTGAILMHKHGAHAATDVTGFGLLGHANNLASNQDADVSLLIDTLPVIKYMTAVADRFDFFRLKAGYSAETSGGLLICLPADKADAFIADILELDGEPAWIVGRVVDGDKTASIVDSPKIVEV